MTPVRTRFAPSPTGRLHLGNLRIAAFNWLFARKHDGAFVLRVEDTDVERNVEGSEALLRDDLRWLGLEWDEGPDVGGHFGPYRQSERLDVYRSEAEHLVERGAAFRCFCTEAELEAERERVSGGEVLRYSGRCRGLGASEVAARTGAGEASVIRFAVPDDDGVVDVEDEIRGSISFPLSDLSDFVILRADGRPTYNFAVVIDDVGMRISHVIRGAGHISNTPRQILLFRALDAEPPRFAHLPTVLAPEGGKLSKRTGSSGAGALRARGFHPDGVLNYMSLLGWSSPDGREELSRAELVERISLDRVGASDTTFDPEKMSWLSGRHIAAMDLDDLVLAVEPFVPSGTLPEEASRRRVAVDVLRSRLATFGDVADHVHHFTPDPEAWGAALQQLEVEAAGVEVVRAVRDALKALDAWERGPIGEAIRATGKAIGARGPGLFHPLRVALTGQTSGPDLSGILEALGREESLSRLSRVEEGPGV